MVNVPEQLKPCSGRLLITLPPPDLSAISALMTARFAWALVNALKLPFLGYRRFEFWRTLGPG